jgi:alkyl hydroperoxide reductase subunit AhpC
MQISTKAAYKLKALDKAAIDGHWVCFCVPMNFTPLMPLKFYVWSHNTANFKLSRNVFHDMYAIKMV